MRSFGGFLASTPVLKYSSLHGTPWTFICLLCILRLHPMSECLLLRIHDYGYIQNFSDRDVHVALSLVAKDSKEIQLNPKSGKL